MGKRRSYTRELLEEAVRTSLTMREVLRKLNAPNLAGGTHSHISRRIKFFGISTQHFIGQAHGRGGRSQNKKTADQILIYHVDGTRQRAINLVRSLLEIGRPYKCFDCGLREWRGKKLILEIEHKDGDFQNDRPENIEFICPNCHSQTATFCRGKKLETIVENKKKGEEIKKARRERNHPSVQGYWRTRDKPNSRKVERPSPTVLQSLIQTLPLTKIGEKFGVSDNAVRKWIKRYGMELPKLFGRSRGTNSGA